MKGGDEHAQFFTNGNVIESVDTMKSFENEDTIGVWLNMNTFTVTYIVNKKEVFKYQNQNWKVNKLKKIV